MKKALKRTLSLMLTVVMLVSCWVFFAPTESTAATAGSYTVKLTIRVEDNSDSDHVNGYYYRVYYKSNNGTGSETGDYVEFSKSDLSSVYTASNGSTKTVSKSVPGFPWKLYGYLDCNGTGFMWAKTNEYRAAVKKITVGSIDIWTANNQTNNADGLYLGSTKNEKNASVDWDGNTDGNDSSWGKVSNHSGAWKSSKKPYASSITAISGGTSSITLNTDGTSLTTSAFSAGTVKDQYSVNWYQDASLSCSSHTGISFSSNKITAASTANAASNYTLTLTETCGSASNTKTVSVTVFKYKVTFYDENGTTVLKSEQTVDYGASATAPGNPTKAYDSSKHYTFAGWTGDGYTSLTSGKQTRAVTASYTGTTHTNTSKTTTSTYLKTAATCTDAAVYYYKCTGCAYKSSSTYTSGSALGHDYSSQTTTSTYLKSAATCTSPAVYYYKCSRCTSKGSDTYTNGNALGHDHTSKTITDTYKKSDATCTSPAVYYYKCSRCADKGSTTYTDGSALGHNNVECSTAPTNGVANSGTVYYHCTRCDKYFGSHYNTSTSSYEAVESTTYETPSAAQTAVAASEPIPAPAFNNFADSSIAYNYSTRGAGLKIAGSSAVDFTQANALTTIKQGLRFTASMHIPAGVGYTGDNRITDFGYVWSQTGLVNPDTDISNLEIGKTNVQKTSIVANNSGKSLSDIANWTGVSEHSNDGLGGSGKTLTFNLVVNIKAENWKRAYCARAYITYIYNGRTYTVYDDGYSSRTVAQIANAVVANAQESAKVRSFCQTKIVNNLGNVPA